MKSRFPKRGNSYKLYLSILFYFYSFQKRLAIPHLPLMCDLFWNYLTLELCSSIVIHFRANVALLLEYFLCLHQERSESVGCDKEADHSAASGTHALAARGTDGNGPYSTAVHRLLYTKR